MSPLAMMPLVSHRSHCAPSPTPHEHLGPLPNLCIGKRVVGLQLRDFLVVFLTGVSLLSSREGQFLTNVMIFIVLKHWRIVLKTIWHCGSN